MAHGTWQTTSGGGGLGGDAGGRGGGGGTLALIAGAAIAVVALAPVILAAVVAIVKALVIAIVVLTVAAVAVWRMRSRRPVRELPVRHSLLRAQARVLPAQPTEPAAIENHYHSHFYGMTADDVAEAIARRQEQS